MGDEVCLGVEHPLHLNQTVLDQRAAARHDVEDGVGHAHGGGYLYAAGNLVDVGLDMILFKEAFEDAGVGGGDAASRRSLRKRPRTRTAASRTASR